MTAEEGQLSSLIALHLFGLGPELPQDYIAGNDPGRSVPGTTGVRESWSSMAALARNATIHCGSTRIISVAPVDTAVRGLDVFISPQN